MYIFVGPNSCTMKMHLRHIPKYCRDWGPLWAYSCFPFETINHHIISWQQKYESEGTCTLYILYIIAMESLCMVVLCAAI